jgi:ABC-type Fe3+-hydroxamate transport system substrate-binding protein
MNRAMLLITALLVGCAGTTVPADPTKMSAEQLREWVKDRNANISCAIINSVYGRSTLVYANLDRSVVVNGTVSVDSECKVTITNAAKAASAP